MTDLLINCPECGEPVTTKKCAPVPRRPTEGESENDRHYTAGPRWWECANGHWELIGSTSSALESKIGSAHG